MFNIKDYFDRPYNVDFLEANVGGETFRIRRMDGKERIVFNSIEQAYARVHYLLSRCLMDGFSNRPIGDTDAERFISRFGVLATRLANEVIRLNDEAAEKEIAMLEEAEKNSLATVGRQDTASTAVVTE